MLGYSVSYALALFYHEHNYYLTNNMLYHMLLKDVVSKTTYKS